MLVFVDASVLQLSKLVQNSLRLVGRLRAGMDFGGLKKLRGILHLEPVVISLDEALEEMRYAGEKMHECTELVERYQDTDDTAEKFQNFTTDVCARMKRIIMHVKDHGKHHDALFDHLEECGHQDFIDMAKDMFPMLSEMGGMDDIEDLLESLQQALDVKGAARKVHDVAAEFIETLEDFSDEMQETVDCGMGILDMLRELQEMNATPVLPDFSVEGDEGEAVSLEEAAAAMNSIPFHDDSSEEAPWVEANGSSVGLGVAPGAGPAQEQSQKAHEAQRKLKDFLEVQTIHALGALEMLGGSALEEMLGALQELVEGDLEEALGIEDEDAEQEAEQQEEGQEEEAAAGHEEEEEPEADEAVLNTAAGVAEGEEEDESEEDEEDEDEDSSSRSSHSGSVHGVALAVGADHHQATGSSQGSPSPRNPTLVLTPRAGGLLNCEGVDFADSDEEESNLSNANADAASWTSI
mmetsp:Transcript_104840/g.338086  ORF Transcript_104840/g.338086 Transcript_104840/m.338086 type:complete len:466 (+) Transcript_104840:230-1627(+)